MKGPGVDEEVPFSFRIETDAEIVEVTDSGYVTETTITNAELEEGPPGLDPASFAQIEGVTFRQETSAEGATGDPELVAAGQVTDAQRQAFDQYIGQLKSASIAYPSEPVGPGARWRATQAVESQGFSFDITYEYELTSIEGDSYRIDVTYDEGIDEDVEQGGQTGRMRGTVTGTRPDVRLAHQPAAAEHVDEAGLRRRHRVRRRAARDGDGRPRRPGEHGRLTAPHPSVLR